MPTTPPRVADTDLIAEARGLAYDTATILYDVARRMPAIAYRLYAIADQLRSIADELGKLGAVVTGGDGHESKT